MASSWPRGCLSVFALGAALLACPAPAHAGPPAADEVRRAAASFDEGSRAYKSDQFDEAASHFEAADEAVPGAKALRLAMVCRSKAGQKARAATLAGQALLRYPEDAKLGALAHEIIAAGQDQLHRVEVRCTPDCILAIGTRAVPGKRRGRWLLFLPPGEATVSASFASGGSDQQVLVAHAGGSNELNFLSVPAQGRPAGSGHDPAPSAAAADSEPASSEPDEAAAEAGESSWIASPWVFVAGVVATAAVGGVTVWSGVDTVNNPGQDAVREQCVGLGTECPAYQDGVAKQTRTNILIGATAGTAALTALFGLLVTDWGGDEAEQGAALFVTPELEPTAAGLVVGGRF